MHVYPYFKAEAEAGTVIDIRSDRYIVRGGPGDSSKTYNSQRIEYICTEGENDFESLLCLFGEQLVITCSKPIKINWAGL